MSYRIKIIIAVIFYYLGISYFIFRLTNLLFRRQIRVVNYHGTPRKYHEVLEQHLLFYKRYYENIDENNLRNFLNNTNDKNVFRGIIISFDDGKRNNFDVAYPLLEKYGFTGWFMLPVDFMDASKEIQASEINSDIDLQSEYSDGRFFVDWDEAELLGRHHVVCVHTASHYRFKSGDNEELLNLEITDAKLKIESRLNKGVNSFCWVGGEESHYTKNAYSKIIDSGFEFSFTTNNKPVLPNENHYLLNRSNVETTFSKELFLFHLCGIVDLVYFPKRYRLRKRLLHNTP